MTKRSTRFLSWLVCLALLLTQLSGVVVMAEENEVVSVTAVATRTLVENIDGYWTWSWDDDGNEVEWFCYEVEYTEPTITVTYKDGRTITGDRYEIYEAAGYWPSLYGDQEYNAPWSVGKHTATVEFMGVTGEFEMEVVEHPIASVTAVATRTLVENNDGYWNEHWDGEDSWVRWFCYDVNYTEPVITVTYKDGRTITGDQNAIYEATGRGLIWGTDQWYDAQWSVGKHKATVEFMGVTGEFEVEVEENPIASVTAVATRTLMENVAGYWNEHWDENDNEVKWFCYNVYDTDPIITVTYKDGRTITGNEYEIHEATGYWLSWSSDQGYDAPWSVGKHTATVEFMGVTGEFEVEVVENPIASVTAVATRTLVENADGYWTWSWDENDNEVDWFCYYIYDVEPTIIVTYKDGRTIAGNEYEIHEATGYGMAWSTDQRYDAPWSVGKHTATVEFMGVTGEFEVEVVENPIVNIELQDIAVLEEHSNGWWADDDSYFEYNHPDFTLKVTYRDGSTKVQRCELGSAYLDGYWISTSSDQSEQPWTVGGENLFTVEYMGKTVQGSVTIMEESDYDFFVQDGGVFITGYRLQATDTLEIPDNIAGIPVIGIDSLEEADPENITIPASVRFISEGAFNGCSRLKQITVADGNTAYSSIDGVLYNAAADTLVYYPMERGTTYMVPASVTNIDFLSDSRYQDLTISFSPDSTAFCTVDGVTYTADMTKIVYCDKNKTGSYTAPDSVTEIVSGAFANCTKLTQISVPDSVTDIVYRTFAGCESLAQVDLPQTVISLGDYAFSDCVSLQQIALPSALVSISNSAFEDSGLTDVTIPDNVLDVGGYAFSGTPLVSVTIGKQVESIGYSAFYECEKLESIAIPDNVKTLGSSAFAGCYALQSVSIGAGLTEIQMSTFNECTSLTEIVIPDTIQVIYDFAFADCTSLKKAVIGNGTVLIGQRAFSNCPLTDLTIGNKVATIDEFAFANTDLVHVSIPNSVTAIAYGGFANSSDLEDIDMPDSVISIGGHALDGTKWFNDQPDGATYIGKVLYRYKGDVPDATELTVKPGTLGIGDYAFENVVSAEDDDLPYYNTSGLTSVILPDGLLHIGNYAFYGTGLTKITIPHSVAYIGWSAFSGCDDLTIYGVTGSYAEAYANDHDIPFVSTGLTLESNGIEVIGGEEEMEGVLLRATAATDAIDQLPEEYQDNAIVYDIYLEKDGQKIQPDGSVTVKIPVPEGMDADGCRVYHVEDGTMTDMHAVRQGEYMVFTAYHFSYYALVEMPAYTPGNVDETGDITANDALLALQAATGKVTLSDIQKQAADVDGTSGVSANDALMILQYATKKITVFSVDA